MKEKNKNKKINNMIAYIFIAPAMLFFLLIIVLPAIYSIFLSLTNWDGLSPKINFVGLRNYIDLISGLFSGNSTSKVFSYALLNNIVWIFGSITVPVFLALILSSIMVRNKIKFANIFQLIFFLPEIITLAVASIAWRWIYTDDFSPVTAFMRAHGYKNFSFSLLISQHFTWLSSMTGLYIIQVWASFGFLTVIYVSAMRNIDESMYEAAKIDGCNAIQQFFKITLPSLRETTSSVLLLSIIWSFMLFDVVFFMFKPYPPDWAKVLAYIVFSEGTLKNQVGYGATVSIVLSMLVLIVSTLFTKIRSKGDA